MRRKWTTLSIVACTVLITICLVLSSGCVQPEQTPTQITLIDPPEDMTRILNQYETVMIAGYENLYQQLRTATQDLVEHTDNSTKITEILQTAYAANPEITAFVWNPIGTGDRIPVPNTIPRLNEDLPQYQETDFTGKEILFAPPTFIHEYGHVTEASLPVYADDGTYAGYLSLYTDCGILFHRFAGEIPELANYGIVVVEPTGKIIYCTNTEYNGLNLSTTPLEVPKAYKENQTVPLTLESGATIHRAYSPLNLEIEEQISVWKTTNLMGTDLRLMIDRPVEPWSVPAYHTFTPNGTGLMEDVYHIHQYAASHTKEQTLSYLKTLKLDEEREAVAFDMAGHVLSTSDKTVRITNTSYLDRLDAYDVPANRHMVYLAQQGGGAMYKYESASFGDLPTQALLYLIYVLPIDETWYIAVYSPAETQIRPIDHHKTGNAIKLARSAVEKAWKDGKEAVLADINSGSSELVAATPDDYILFSAIDMHGNVLADPRENITGTNIFSVVDVNGASVGRHAVMYAKNGGGLIYSTEKTDDPNIIDMQLISLEPVDETWFILVGVKIDQMQRHSGVGVQ